MLLSMTGYGKHTASAGGVKVTAEIKTLNSGKGVDMAVKLPPEYRSKEMEIRQAVASRVARGKVDFSITRETTHTSSVAFNADAMGENYRSLKLATEKAGIPAPPDWLSIVLRMPDSTTREESAEIGDEEWGLAMEAVGGALDALVSFRRQEGIALESIFRQKLDNIEGLEKSLELYEGARVEKIRARLTEALQKIPAAEYDKGRLEQEMIYYIEKLDISEEKQRLSNHIAYFRETMERDEMAGKKLGFIAQEMGREINTTGSKSNIAEMQNIVVKMKDELEQIKEQVLNVL